jgi:uncharacterized membrane protein YbhN (UPF0104 family)
MPTDDNGLRRAGHLLDERRCSSLEASSSSVKRSGSPEESEVGAGVRKRPRHWLPWAFLILVFAGACVYVLPMREFGSALSKLGPREWLQMGGLYFSAMLLLFLPSHRFLVRAGYGLGYLGFVAVMLASQAVNVVTPLRMGFPVRVYLLRERYHVPVSTGTLLVPVEMLMGILVNIAFALGFGSWWRAEGNGFTLEVLLGAGASVALAAYFLSKRAATGGRLTPSGTPGRVAAVIESLRPALSQASVSMLALFALFYAMNTLLGACILKVAAGSAGFEKPMEWLIGAWASAYLMGVLSLLPQGIGVGDASLAWILHHGGASVGQAAAVVLVVRVVMSGLPFVAGLLAWAGLGLSSVPATETRGGRAGSPP